jgi:hypothetical protein
MAGLSIAVNANQLLTFRAKMRAATLGVPREVRRINQRYAVILGNSLTHHASGRPGPNVVTGAFRASMMVKVTGFSIVAINNSPQARRLEYGFVGTDRLGRHYAQPPYPSVIPALLEVSPQWIAELQQVVPRMFK